jgi:general secretion pathway protein D
MNKSAKNSAYVRFSISLLLMISMLSPVAVLAGDGKKFFKEGMKAEVAEQWDTAVEQFALAVADNPKNPEYRLHYQRAIFNASQMYMKKGNLLANEKDYEGAYLAFRKAYAYDPVNELAKAQMEKMVRLQKGLNGENTEEQKDANGNIKLVKTGFNGTTPQDIQVPQKLEKLRDVPFPSGVDLQFIIKELATDLDLNVLFDSGSFRTDRKIKIELKNVTAAKALDYIFLQEGLFFQKVGPRTILVAESNRRQQFQQLVLRTFYLANADPKDVQKVLQGAIPAQPGRTPTISIVDEDTNSITIRDTEENIRLMGKLITSLDKDRAEVVMDVAIYEVSKSDLLKFGNQIGSEASLTNLGGTTRTTLGNNEFNSPGAVAGSLISRAFGIGLVLPAVNLVAFQNKQNTKLLASTQIHAFNNEDSSARIGQRVPVRTATISNGFNNPGTPGSGGGGGFLSDVINYEQVGLTLKFKPIVFPNQDVQVAMEIESKDVVACGGGDNPCFSERIIKGTARVQNNKTLLLASVAQDTQSDGRQGLPLLGLIPIIGRLFSAPTKDNRQVDIVIAITPKVIRAPTILPEDEIERPTGSLAVPTSGSLEAMIIQEEREELLAAARRLPTVAQVQLPDQKVEEVPAYVKSDSATANSQTTGGAENQTIAETQTANSSMQIAGAPLSNLRPIDSGVRTLQINQTSDNARTNQTTTNFLETSLKSPENPVAESPSNAPQAGIQFLQNLSEMKAGEKTKIAVMIKSADAFRSAVLGLRFDDKKVAVRSVSFGDVFGGTLANTSATPFINQNGKMFVSLSSPKDSAKNSSGILAYVEVEALTDGKHELAFDKDILNVLTADGKNFAVKF